MRKQRHKENKPWEPDSKQLEWFTLWCEEGLSCAEIGRRAKPPVTRVAVHLSVHKTEEWFRRENYDNVLRLKGKHTVALERVFTEAMAAWARSIGDHKVKTVKTTAGGESSDDDEDTGPTTETTVKSEELNGTPAFLGEARSALADIRKIWGCDSPAKSSVDMHHSEEIPELPAQHDFASRAEAYAAISKILGDKAKELGSTEK